MATDIIFNYTFTNTCIFINFFVEIYQKLQLHLNRNRMLVIRSLSFSSSLPPDIFLIFVAEIGLE